MTASLGIIGNCSTTALVSRGSIEWLCWPRPDSSFVFGPLLDREKGGEFTVEGVDADTITHGYVENTNVLRTIFSGPDGSFELLDFAPRFVLYNRAFKPSMLLRIIRPLEGDPRAIVRCRPVYDYGRIAASSLAFVEPHRVHGPRHAAPADDERAAHLCRGRPSVPARP